MNLLEPYVTDPMRQAVADTLHTRWIGQGPRVDEFEHAFQQRFNGHTAVATGSGTDALHLAYQLAGIREGSIVAAPLFTCTATNIPLLYQHADIRFYDVAPDSLNSGQAELEALDLDELDAIVLVHYGGQPAPISIPGLPYPVIEDCAQALGTDIGFADFSCFSFQAVKHVTTGDGGMLLLFDLAADYTEKARRLRWFGIDRAAKQAGVWENDIREVGFKYQMTDIAASMGLASLETLDAQIAHRRALRDRYMEGLAGLDGIRVLDRDPGSACWLMTVLVDGRESFRRALAAEGVESDQVHYRNDRYTIFADSRGDFPNMDAVEDRYLCLPLHMGLDVGDVDRVCAVAKAGW